MKSRKFITASVALLMTMGFASTASAAEIGNTTTTGDVTFEGADPGTEGGNPTAPDDNNENGGEVITPGPGEGSHTKGALRIEHVPTLHFGKQKTSTKNQSYNSLWNKGTVGTGATTVDIPVFAQVRDETGLKTNTWDLNLSQTTAFSSKSGTLDNTRVHIYAGTAYNSLKDSGGAAVVTPISIDATNGYTEVPLSADGKGAITVLSGENTNGSDTSIVFSDTTQYDPGDDVNNKDYSVTGDSNQGLKLFVPSTDVAYAEGYSATFTWSLDDTL